MCTTNKRFLFYLLIALLLSCAAGALRSQELPNHGKTQALSPNSGLSSNSSEEHLTTWTQLSSEFEETLNQHEATLNEVLQKLKTSEHNGQKLNDLLNQSLRQNEDLKNYNQQIGERMQERDEDLSAAYDQIDKLEKRFLKDLIVIIVMGVLIIGAVVFKVLRLLRIISI